MLLDRLEISRIEQSARVKFEAWVEELFGYVVNQKVPINEVPIPPSTAHRRKTVQEQEGLFVCRQLRPNSPHMLKNVYLFRCIILNKPYHLVQMPIVVSQTRLGVLRRANTRGSYPFSLQF
jgi:hypothetical protein